MTVQSPANEADDAPLPSWFARHIEIGFDSDDVAALVSSIDSSQQTASPSHLPAEVLLVILEFVPIDFVLDWRLVCRGFRDAIDGRILYHHLRRTQLIGYMGSRYSRSMEHLNDEQYDKIHLLRATFRHVEGKSGVAERAGPVWSKSHAVFQIDDAWSEAFRQVGGAAANNGHPLVHADTVWLNVMDRLELRRPEEGFGTLRWCIRLDHAVLDMAFPFDRGRTTFDIDVNLYEKAIWVAWRPMLLGFLKTESALRRKLAEKQDCAFTFNHAEDCLRAIRRQRLHSTLDPDNRIDRHIKWSLRLLPPLFGRANFDTNIALEDVENDAMDLLLLLRREAAMSRRQIAHLHQLAVDYDEMQKDVAQLDQAFGDFKGHLTMSGFQLSIALPALNPLQVTRNPIAWPDKLRASIEELVGKWKSQKMVIEQMKAMLIASNIALTVPEDSFDDLGSDF